MASHQLWISTSCGHSSSGRFSLTLLHLSFHMKWALSDMRIRYIWLMSLRVLPSWFLNSTRPHPVMRPIFRSSGHVSCFFSHSRSAFFHTIFWPGMSQCRIICSRSSFASHFLHLSLSLQSSVSVSSMFLFCVLCIDFHMKV